MHNLNNSLGLIQFLIMPELPHVKTSIYIKSGSTMINKVQSKYLAKTV